MGLEMKTLILALKLIRSGLGAIAAALLGAAAIGIMFESMPWQVATQGIVVAILIGLYMLLLELLILIARRDS